MTGVQTCALPISALSEGLHRHKHRVYVITYRGPTLREITEKELADYGIKHDGLRLAPLSAHNIGAWKRGVIKQLKIDLMIDDMPEVLAKAECQTLWVCTDYDLPTCIEALKDKI